MNSNSTYKGRIWVTNTWNKNFHEDPEAKSYSGGYCTCIRCLVEQTTARNPIAGPAIFNSPEELDENLVGLYLEP